MEALSDRGLSFAWLAKKLGTSKSTVSQWKSGKNRITNITKIAILKVLEDFDNGRSGQDDLQGS
jgi:transcriptional regulator with XRE-family HTH domain